MYRLRNFKRKLLRWWRYSIHLWKENPWNEYDSLFRIMIIQMELIATNLEKGITMSGEQDAKRIRLASKLLKMGMEEYYGNKYLKDHWKKDTTGFDDSYTVQNGITAYSKDHKCIQLALGIIAKDYQGWWN